MMSKNERYSWWEHLLTNAFFFFFFAGIKKGQFERIKPWFRNHQIILYVIGFLIDLQEFKISYNPPT